MIVLPGGLRTRLVLAFAGIVLVCLALAGTAFVYQLRPYQTQQSLDRLADLAVPLSFQVRLLEIEGASRQEMAAFLNEQARRLDVRILLLRHVDQTVLHDTGGDLEGDQLVFEGSAPSRGNAMMRGTVHVPEEGTLAMVMWVPSSGEGSSSSVFGDRPPRRVSPVPRLVTVALATPESTLAASWMQVAPQLWRAGIVALIASIIVAFFIARSISRPLGAMTLAAEAMARGDYNQQIRVRGDDEVGRLASAFNLMAQQVARSNRTLRDFLADVSHELRTPLTTIQGFSQAILDGTASGPTAVEESARIIKEDADRMHRMVEDLLYLSRIESGQQAMELDQVDLVELANGAVRRAQGRSSGQTVRLDATEQAVLVWVDPHRIGQVLDNLLTNALHHSPQGGEITVQVSASPRSAQVRVHNTGSYVSSEDRERIFERFWRGTGDGSGSGLGLSIAQQIARSHGGRIDLESSQEDGTSFTLVVPTQAPSAARAH